MTLKIRIALSVAIGTAVLMTGILYSGDPSIVAARPVASTLQVTSAGAR